MGLNLTQLLWDGLGTRNDIERLGHDRLARCFDFVDAGEQAALEAARAHYDVLRFRRQVQLAEDNNVQHRYAFLQIQSRFKAGVGRGVDLEQAGARQALAESNLTTEVANLHDVTARFLRGISSAPAKGLPALAMMRTALPASAGEAMNIAVRQSASVSASIESLRAARSLADGRQSALQPRVEARLRSSLGKNIDGMVDQSLNSAAEIVLNWNLYNSGADQARLAPASQPGSARRLICATRPAATRARPRQSPATTPASSPISSCCWSATRWPSRRCATPTASSSTSASAACSTC